MTEVRLTGKQIAALFCCAETWERVHVVQQFKDQKPENWKNKQDLGYDGRSVPALEKKGLVHKRKQDGNTEALITQEGHRVANDLLMSAPDIMPRNMHDKEDFFEHIRSLDDKFVSLPEA